MPTAGGCLLGSAECREQNERSCQVACQARRVRAANDCAAPWTSSWRAQPVGPSTTGAMPLALALAPAPALPTRRKPAAAARGGSLAAGRHARRLRKPTAASPTNCWGGLPGVAPPRPVVAYRGPRSLWMRPDRRFDAPCLPHCCPCRPAVTMRLCTLPNGLTVGCPGIEDEMRHVYQVRHATAAVSVAEHMHIAFRALRLAAWSRMARTRARTARHARAQPPPSMRDLIAPPAHRRTWWSSSTCSTG